MLRLLPLPLPALNKLNILCTRDGMVDVAGSNPVA